MTVSSDKPSRHRIIAAIVLGVLVLAAVFLRTDYFRHEWYHGWTEPRRHEQAEAFASSLGAVVTNDARFAEVQWFVQVRPHRDPAIQFRGAVQSDGAIRDLRAAVDARKPPFDIDWQIAVTNGVR